MINVINDFKETNFNSNVQSNGIIKILNFLENLVSFPKK